MITSITGTDFKGRTFDQTIGEHTLFVGENAAGKSSITSALQIALTGEINANGKCYKKAGDILSIFGSGNKMSVGFRIGEQHFVRLYSRNAKGAVSQTCKINRKGLSALNFGIAMGNAGSPSAVDLVEFMNMSDQAKTDKLFELFADGASTVEIDIAIEDLKEKRNNINAEIKKLEGANEINHASKVNISLPAGTLAECQDKITQLTTDVQAKQKELAEFDATEKAEKEAAEKLAAETARIEKQAKENAAAEIERARKMVRETAQAELKKVEESGTHSLPSESTATPLSPPAEKAVETLERKHEGKPDSCNIIESLQKIIQTMDAAGCEVCSAKLVVKGELNKFRKAVGNG